MTLVEFLARIPREPQWLKVMAVLYYKQRYEGEDTLTVDSLRRALRQARVRNAKTMNISRALDQCGPYVTTAGSEGRAHLWSLTGTGAEKVREAVGLSAEPEVEQDVSALVKIAARVKDPVTRSYVEEAIKCLGADARRASVVFLWAGAIRTLQEEMIQYDKASLNAAIKKHDPRARNVSTVDHFSYIKDKTALLAAAELNLLDKSEKDTLEENLNLRNKCGHPVKYTPREHRVRAFIEDVVQIVFE